MNNTVLCGRVGEHVLCNNLKVAKNNGLCGNVKSTHQVYNK